MHAWPDTWRSPDANVLGFGLVGAKAAAVVSGSGFRAGAGAVFRELPRQRVVWAPDVTLEYYKLQLWSICALNIVNHEHLTIESYV